MGRLFSFRDRMPRTTHGARPRYRFVDGESHHISRRERLNHYQMRKMSSTARGRKMRSAKRPATGSSLDEAENLHPARSRKLAASTQSLERARACVLIGCGYFLGMLAVEFAIDRRSVERQLHGSFYCQLLFDVFSTAGFLRVFLPIALTGVPLLLLTACALGLPERVACLLHRKSTTGKISRGSPGGAKESQGLLAMNAPTSGAVFRHCCCVFVFGVPCLYLFGKSVVATMQFCDAACGDKAVCNPDNVEIRAIIELKETMRNSHGWLICLVLLVIALQV